MKTFGEKGRVGVSRDCPKFLGTPNYLKNGKSYGFQILHGHLWAQSEQKPIKNSGKVAVGVFRDSGKFSGRPYIGHIARSSLRLHSFLVSLFFGQILHRSCVNYFIF